MNIIEKKIQDYLVLHNIFPFSVLYIKELPLLKISFYLEDDITDFIEVSGLSKICDNSGFREIKDSILLWGIALSNFLRDVGC